jgi:pyridoxamine 5'-phosphate oxidase
VIPDVRFDNLALTRVSLAESRLKNQPTAECLPDDLPSDPMHMASDWLHEATASGVQPHPNAMTLATVDSRGQPSSRVVLCKAFVPDPGYLVFYSNYNSRKSIEMQDNPRVAVTFHWDTLGRQIRIEGTVVRSPAQESDDYSASRDPGSQLGAWGSDQSEDIPSRQALVAQIRQRAGTLGIELAHGTEPALQHDAAAVPRPPHWGGFRVWAAAIELWMSGGDRIHDRALWRRDLLPTSGDAFTASAWTGTRLQP